LGTLSVSENLQSGDSVQDFGIQVSTDVPVSIEVLIYSQIYQCLTILAAASCPIFYGILRYSTPFASKQLIITPIHR
jgi:hypothetical protein